MSQEDADAIGRFLSTIDASIALDESGVMVGMVRHLRSWRRFLSDDAIFGHDWNESDLKELRQGWMLAALALIECAHARGLIAPAGTPDEDTVAPWQDPAP